MQAPEINGPRRKRKLTVSRNFLIAVEIGMITNRTILMSKNIDRQQKQRRQQITGSLPNVRNEFAHPGTSVNHPSEHRANLCCELLLVEARVNRTKTKELKISRIVRMMQGTCGSFRRYYRTLMTLMKMKLMMKFHGSMQILFYHHRIARNQSRTVVYFATQLEHDFLTTTLK